MESASPVFSACHSKCLKSNDSPHISLLETKGVVNYAELVSQERKKRHLLSNPPSDSATSTTTTTTTTTTGDGTPATPPLNASVEEASIDTAGDESVDTAGDESVDAEESVEGSTDASVEVKKSSPKRSVCTQFLALT